MQPCAGPNRDAYRGLAAGCKLPAPPTPPTLLRAPAQVMWNTKLRGRGKKVNREVGAGCDQAAPCPLPAPGRLACSRVRSASCLTTTLCSSTLSATPQFAFLSYATRAEAARAVHWLDGARIADLQKDGGGITVEAENGEGGTAEAPRPGGGSGAAAKAPAGSSSLDAAPASAGGGGGGSGGGSSGGAGGSDAGAGTPPA
jgi:hypothetical protein